MMLAHNVVDDPFGHARENDHSSRCATSGWIGRSADDAKKERRRRQEFNIEQGTARSTVSKAVAGMFMSTFEREFGDAGFVELAQTFRDHALVLLLGRTRKRQIETELTRELERD